MTLSILHETEEHLKAERAGLGIAEQTASSVAIQKCIDDCVSRSSGHCPCFYPLP
jgi:hypothetical protein